MKMTQVRVDRLFRGVAATIFALFPAAVLAQGADMRGGMGHMMGGMGLMGLIGILVIVALALGAAALIKYLRKK